MKEEKPKRRDVHAEITERLIAVIERGDPLPWVRPWEANGGASGMPVNATTGKAYRGGNVISLWMTAQLTGYSSNEWATFKQWQTLSTEQAPVSVKKGEKGTVGVYYSTFEKKDAKAEPGDKAKRIPFARAFYLFNRDQVDGLPQLELPADLPDLTERRARFDAMVEATGARIEHGGDRACFMPDPDKIRMPLREQFRGTDGGDPTTAYYSTLAHELTHWTGHKSRLDRTFGKRFGDNSYAIEELTAELGAAFACAEHGLNAETRHAAYLKNWLDVLKSDSRALFAAASKAAEAVDYMHARKKEERQAA